MNFFLNTDSINKHRKDALYLSIPMFVISIVIPSFLVLLLFVLCYFKYFRSGFMAIPFFILFVSFILFVYRKISNYIRYIIDNFRKINSDDIYECTISDSEIYVSKNNELYVSLPFDRVKKIEKFRDDGFSFRMKDNSNIIIVGFPDMSVFSFLENREN